MRTPTQFPCRHSGSYLQQYQGSNVSPSPESWQRKEPFCGQVARHDSSSSIHRPTGMAYSNPRQELPSPQFMLQSFSPVGANPHSWSMQSESSEQAQSGMTQGRTTPLVVKHRIQSSAEPVMLPSPADPSPGQPVAVRRRRTINGKTRATNHLFHAQTITLALASTSTLYFSFPSPSTPPTKGTCSSSAAFLFISSGLLSYRAVVPT